jgi:hypothetical protein
VKSGAAAYSNTCSEAFLAWAHILDALSHSDRPDDQAPARNIRRFGRESPFLRDIARERGQELPAPDPQHSTLQRTRPDIEIER